MLQKDCCGLTFLKHSLPSVVNLRFSLYGTIYNVLTEIITVAQIITSRTSILTNTHAKQMVIIRAHSQRSSSRLVKEEFWNIFCPVRYLNAWTSVLAVQQANC